jgi:predicted metal-dependent phosphoesterase TrpH
MRGVLHVHSVFSDGEESLERIAERFRFLGMQFVVVSDHAETFDQARMDAYVRLCASLSKAGFLVIPGLEFAMHGGHIHMLGYGITTRFRFDGIEKLVEGIHAQGGLAVLAHPDGASAHLIAPVRTMLDGVEIWNGRHDSLWAPRPASIQLLHRIQKVNRKALAYCGIDLHAAAQARKPVYVSVDADRLDRTSIISALAAGRFTLCAGRLAIPSSGRLSHLQELGIVARGMLGRPA